MSDVCPDCGSYSQEKSIVPDESDPTGIGAFSICPACNHRFRFLKLPLFVVSGAGGTGKSTVSQGLPALLPECVVLEGDILWRKDFHCEGLVLLGEGSVAHHVDEHYGCKLAFELHSPVTWPGTKRGSQ